jgi:hypothetical protein
MIIIPGTIAILIAGGYAFYLSQLNTAMCLRLLSLETLNNLKSVLEVSFGILIGREIAIYLN